LNRASWLSKLPGDLGARLSRILSEDATPGEAASAAGPSAAQLPKRPRRAPSLVECLESRQLLSGSISFAGGIDTTNATEGGSSAYLVVTRTDTSAAETFGVAATGTGTDPASGSDYSLTTQVAFGVGVSSATVSIGAVNEGVAEPTETLRLVISGSGATNALTGTCTISDAPLPEVWITSPDSEMAEGGGDATFVIHRDNGGVSGYGTISVNLAFVQPYYMTPDYGLPDLDYSYGVTLGMGPGQTERTITLSADDDSDFEGTESFTVSVQACSSSPADYTIPNTGSRLSDAPGTIIDNDQASVSVYAADDQASEDARDPATFTISRDRTPSSSLNVYFTLSGSATVGTVAADDADEDGIADHGSSADYLIEGASYVGSGTWCATITSGESSVDVSVVPLNDALVEGDEDVTLTLCETTQASNGTPEYCAPAGAGAVATATLKSIVAQSISDPNVPWEDIGTWLNDLDDDTPTVRAAATSGLTSALATYPELLDYLGWWYQTQTKTEAQETFLQGLISIVRLRVEDNQLIPELNWATTAAKVMIGAPDDLPFFVKYSGESGGSAITVGGNPGAFTLIPKSAIERYTGEFTVQGWDGNDNLLFEYTVTFSFAIVQE
jgi:hypothetical protein